MEEKEVSTGITVPKEVFKERRKEAWKSQNIDKLSGSLAKAQAEMKGAKAKATNPFFKSNYADLHTVIESSLPYLNKYGLSIVQGHDKDQSGTFYVTTTLLHESGQWIKSRLQMPIGGKKDAQAVGATTTYARRFALSAMVGIAQTDDDGESLSDRAIKQRS
tara:strand:+ start:392 stop:877 length:486 start_codon:yes stop_codon:yes gene_type:complete